MGSIDSFEFCLLLGIALITYVVADFLILAPGKLKAEMQWESMSQLLRAWLKRFMFALLVGGICGVLATVVKLELFLVAGITVFLWGIVDQFVLIPKSAKVEAMSQTSLQLLRAGNIKAAKLLAVACAATFFAFIAQNIYRGQV